MILTALNISNHKSDDLAAAFVRSRPAGRDVARDEVYKVIHHWVRQCVTTHKTCTYTKYVQLPTRLIDVGPSQDSLKLYVTKPGESGRYLALSYCWGRNQSLKTTISSLMTWKSGIPFAAVPKTIQDAIIVTRKLKFRFLWVDCFCIVQDDDKDVAREIAKMAKIYSRAHITISAACSESSLKGFLYVREREKATSRFRLPYQCPDGRKSVIELSPYEFHGHEMEPINTRAWTLQESLLSPRLLIYGSRQLSWSCLGSQYSDGSNDREWPASHPTVQRLDPIVHKALAKPTLALDVDVNAWHTDPNYLDTDVDSWEGMATNPEQLRSFTESWSKVIEDFTQRELTNADDLLLAISGIASVYAKASQDSYVAGLWKSTLKLGLPLLWCNRARLQPRGSRFRAPSWSWASIDTPVSAGGSDATDSEVSVDVLDCRVEPADSSAVYGAVVSGYLTIRGRLHKERWTRKPFSRNDALCFHDLKHHPSGSFYTSVTSATRLDALEDGITDLVGFDLSVWCLEMFNQTTRQDGKDFFCVMGLVLNRNDDGTFRRLGVYELRGGSRKWVDEYIRTETQILTII